MGCCSSTATQVQQLSPQSQPKKSDVETKLPIKSAFREERQPNFADDNQLKAVKKSNDVVVNHMNALNHCHSLIDRCGEYMKILNILSRISPSIPFDPTRGDFFEAGLHSLCLDEIKNCSISVIDSLPTTQYAINILIQLSFNDDIAISLIQQTPIIRLICTNIFKAVRENHNDTNPDSLLFDDVAALSSAALRLMWTLVVDCDETLLFLWIQEGGLEYCFEKVEYLFSHPPDNPLLLEILVWSLGGIRILSRSPMVKGDESISIRAARNAVNFLAKMELIAHKIELGGNKANQKMTPEDPRWEDLSETSGNIGVQVDVASPTRSNKSKSPQNSPFKKSVLSARHEITDDDDDISKAIVEGNQQDAFIVEHSVALLNYLQESKAVTAWLDQMDVSNTANSNVWTKLVGPNARLRNVWDVLVKSAKRFSTHHDVLYHALQALGKAALHFPNIYKKLTQVGAVQVAKELLADGSLNADEDLKKLAIALVDGYEQLEILEKEENQDY